MISMRKDRVALGAMSLAIITAITISGCTVYEDFEESDNTINTGYDKHKKQGKSGLNLLEWDKKQTSKAQEDYITAINHLRERNAILIIDGIFRGKIRYNANGEVKALLNTRAEEGDLLVVFKNNGESVDTILNEDIIKTRAEVNRDEATEILILVENALNSIGAKGINFIEYKGNIAIEVDGIDSILKVMGNTADYGNGLAEFLKRIKDSIRSTKGIETKVIVAFEDLNEDGSLHGIQVIVKLNKGEMLITRLEVVGYADKWKLDSSWYENWYNDDEVYNLLISEEM